MPEAFILSAVRTPVGRFLGALAPLPATRLGALVVAEAVKRAAIDAERVEDVIMGCVLPAGLGQNPARQAAIGGGIPVAAAALTLNKVCGSGLEAVARAVQAIRAGDADVVVAGGFESMSRAPYLLPDIRQGLRMGHGRLLDSMIEDGLWDIHNDIHMGVTAEMVAEKYHISRQQQDRFALASHEKAARAIREGAFEREILPVEVPQKRGQPVLFETDESVRPDTSLEALGKLRPIFKQDGSVTAGNASSCNDGAAACVVVSEKVVAENGLKPMARVLAHATGGVAPEWVMMAPVVAVKKLQKRLGFELQDYDLIELNEAFAVQALAVMGELEMDPKRVNINGGSVAIGHPLGASGARIFTTLLHAMEAHGARKGLAALCLGGGNAVALAVESC